MSEALPRHGSFMYDFMHGEPKLQIKKARRFRFINKWFVVPLYRIYLLPLLGMGRVFLLIYHQGRKSGNRYITPVEYRKKDSHILVFASRGTKTDWYRNAKASPDQVRLRIGFHSYHNPQLEFLEKDEKLETMTWYVTKFPKAASMLFGWDNATDEATPELLEPISEFLEIIRISL